MNRTSAHAVRPHRAPWVGAWALSAAVGCAIPAGALAQMKPDRPREPVIDPDAQFYMTPELQQEFLDAFQSQESPRIVVLVNDALGTTEPGGVLPARADREAFMAELREQFGVGGAVDLIRPETIDAGALREMEILALQPETRRRADDLRRLQVHADVLVHVLLTPSSARSDRPWRAVITAIDLGSGLELASEMQDMPAKWTITEVNKYGNFFSTQMFRKLIARWDARGDTTSHTLKITNLNDDDLRARVLDVLRTMPGVSVASLDSATGIGETSITAYRVRYRGSSGDFYTEVLRALKREVTENPGGEPGGGIEGGRTAAFRGIDFRPGLVTLMAQEALAAGDSHGTAPSPRPTHTQQAYSRAGSPTVAVLVNTVAPVATVGASEEDQLLRRLERLNDTGESIDWLLVRWPGTPSPGDAPLSAEQVRARELRDHLDTALIDELSEEGLTCISTSALRDRMRAAGHAEQIGSADGSDATLRLIELQPLADVVVYAMGVLNPAGSAQGGAAGNLSFTFKAIDTATGVVIDTYAQVLPLDSAGLLGDGQAAVQQEAARRLAQRAASSLLDGVTEHWLQPATITLTITNAPSADEARNLLAYIEQALPRITGTTLGSMTSAGNAVSIASATIRFDGTVQQFLDGLSLVQRTGPVGQPLPEAQAGGGPLNNVEVISVDGATIGMKWKKTQ